MPTRGERRTDDASPTGPIAMGCAMIIALVGLGGGAFWVLQRSDVGSATPVLAPAIAAPISPPPTAPTTTTVAPENGEATGSLPREVIQRVVRLHVREVQRCYEDRLRTDPTLTASVTAHFTIAADGSVHGASVDGSDDTILTTCIAARVDTWTFPSPEGDGIVLVNYPFVFSAS